MRTQAGANLSTHLFAPAGPNELIQPTISLLIYSRMTCLSQPPARYFAFECRLYGVAMYGARGFITILYKYIPSWHILNGNKLDVASRSVRCAVRKLHKNTRRAPRFLRESTRRDFCKRACNYFLLYQSVICHRHLPIRSVGFLSRSRVITRDISHTR